MPNYNLFINAYVRYRAVIVEVAKQAFSCLSFPFSDQPDPGEAAQGSSRPADGGRSGDPSAHSQQCLRSRTGKLMDEDARVTDHCLATCVCSGVAIVVVM